MTIYYKELHPNTSCDACGKLIEVPEIPRERFTLCANFTVIYLRVRRRHDNPTVRDIKNCLKKIKYNQSEKAKKWKSEEYRSRPDVQAKRAASAQRAKEKAAAARLLKPRKTVSAEEKARKAEIRKERYAARRSTPEDKARKQENEQRYKETRAAYRATLAYKESVDRFRKTDKGREANIKKHAVRRMNLDRAVCDFKAYQWRELLDAYGHRCAYCGIAFSADIRPTRDHIVALVNGGHHTKSNIVPACQSCNSSKGHKHDRPLRLKDDRNSESKTRSGRPGMEARASGI